MASAVATDPIPLTVDGDGVIRVGRTRVTLDTVIMAFLDGATAEEIAQQYPSLDLADVYSVIGYYLKRHAETEAYLQQGRALSERIRKENESSFNPSGVRERLLARQSSEKG